MKEGGRVAVPTLSGMQLFAQTSEGKLKYEYALESVRALHAACVPIVGGTDSLYMEGMHEHNAHGESLSRELELLVDAGLSTLEALRSVTALVAEHFELNDRGAIQPSLRADLLMVRGNPLEDIKAVKNVEAVWCAGKRVELKA
ncbi:hypothetical protein CONPUDRAFT_170164 [Coniophora puteana RWD-64-598 SS2]|uniref:Amidohydrolase-related domain-containing protein n=1 Tax=Coniophora puteana (strain RWD-64-598) TaxID=741705 RepID=R7SE65_CONPW|nr:uncharacterized protein CONPUDRAFT_170164 [Coniophora puteana RWD-64-598 SS2]EIW74463.1 hypothetical protein CONPUDRAFT_170164 [Coniophora puteana RWD-64-598 SS2]